MGVWVSVGSRDEPAELSGVSHFLEHLLFKGTETARRPTSRRRSCRRRHQRLHVEEYTAYYCRMPRRHGATGVELLGDVLDDSLLDDEDVERSAR